MTLSSIFLGAPQSKYAGMAILAAVIVVSITILLGKDPVPLSQKFSFVLLIFLMSAPGLLMTLFQLTCIVTGAGFNNQRWWCSAYAWIISVVLILYCIFLIVIATLTLASGQKVLTDVTSAPAETAENFETKMEAANTFAKNLMTSMGIAEPEVAKNETTSDTFLVQGGQSVPAGIEMPEVAAPPAVPTALPVKDEPEAFEDMFSGIGAPF